MYNNEQIFQQYMNESAKNLVGILDVLRLSMLPTVTKTNYPTVVEDGVTYYLLNYKRFNNLEETLKIPHLTDFISNISTTGYISANKTKNNVAENTADALVFNYKDLNIHKTVFNSDTDIKNFSFGSSINNIYKDIVIGNIDGRSAIIEYDFKNLTDFNTDGNDYFTADTNLAIDIDGVNSLKYSNNLVAFNRRVPSAIYHGVHLITPEGIGFDANDKLNSIVKQITIEDYKYLQLSGQGLMFNVKTDNVNYSLKMDNRGISNGNEVIYDVVNNRIRKTNIYSTTILSSQISASYLKTNRFRTLNYSLNNNNNGGLLIGWSESEKKAMIAFGANNTTSYFSTNQIGFRDDDLSCYFSASYFDFNTKIKFFKITDSGDLQFSWGSYFQDTRNIYRNSKIEIGENSELYIFSEGKFEVYGQMNIRNNSLAHVSKSIKYVSDGTIEDGYTVFVIRENIDSTVGLENNICGIGTEFIVINKTNKTLNFHEKLKITENIFSMEAYSSAHVIKLANGEWITF